jgi:hypothetical protein
MEAWGARATAAWIFMVFSLDDGGASALVCGPAGRSTCKGALLAAAAWMHGASWLRPAGRKKVARKLRVFRGFALLLSGMGAPPSLCVWLNRGKTGTECDHYPSIKPEATDDRARKSIHVASADPVITGVTLMHLRDASFPHLFYYRTLSQTACQIGEISPIAAENTK